jgi:hypothetical protein
MFVSLVNLGDERNSYPNMIMCSMGQSGFLSKKPSMIKINSKIKKVDRNTNVAIPW